MKFLKLIILCFILFTSCQKKIITDDYLLMNVNIIDVENELVLENKHVAINADKITAIFDQEFSYSDSVIIIDCSGKFLIPGLWDMHTHYNLIYSYSSPLLVANGVTGVREMWGFMDTIVSIRDQIKNGTLIAPDIYTSGAIIDGAPPWWPGSSGVKNAEEAIEEVNRQVGQGVDFLKIYSFLSRESYFAIAEKSKEYGIPFAGHIPDSVSMWEAMEVNQQSAEHLFGLLEACSSKPEELSKFIGGDLFGLERANFQVETFDQLLFDSLAYSLANSNTWLCPTLTVLRSLSNLDDTTLSKDPRLDYLPISVQEGWKPNFSVEALRVREYYDSQRTKFNLQLSLIGQLAKSGVKIIAGTDFPNPYCFPGFSLHDELSLLVKGDMSPAEALKTATINPATFMGKKGVFGEIAEGQLSSVVLLDANPLLDINNTRTIRAVFLRGKYLDRTALDSLLKSAKDISSNL